MAFLKCLINNKSLFCCLILLIILFILVISFKSKEDEILKLKSEITALVNSNNTLKSELNEKENYILLLNESNKIESDYFRETSTIIENSNIIKEQVYETIISDEKGDIQEWFNTKLPDDIINIINSDINDGMCKNSN